MYSGNTYTLASALDMSSSVTSNLIDAGQFTYWTMVIEWTGTPTGTIEIETSPTQITYTTIPNTTQSTAGTSGSHTVNYSGSGHRYLRVKYTASAGVGSLSVYFTGKR